MKLGCMQASYPTGTNSIQRAHRYSWTNRIPKISILPPEIHRAGSAVAVIWVVLWGLWTTRRENGQCWFSFPQQAINKKNKQQLPYPLCLYAHWCMKYINASRNWAEMAPQTNVKVLVCSNCCCICGHNNFGCNLWVRLASVTGWNETVWKLKQCKVNCGFAFQFQRKPFLFPRLYQFCVHIYVIQSQWISTFFVIAVQSSLKK